jgi:hypothetical protein
MVLCYYVSCLYVLHVNYCDVMLLRMTALSDNFVLLYYGLLYSVGLASLRGSNKISSL